MDLGKPRGCLEDHELSDTKRDFQDEPCRPESRFGLFRRASSASCSVLAFGVDLSVVGALTTLVSILGLSSVVFHFHKITTWHSTY